MIDELREHVGVFKIGFELFLNTGPSVLEIFQEEGLKVFFDGKFLDIPNTVARACESIARRGVDMFTVHASGGRKMLEAASAAVRQESQSSRRAPALILGVTVLTSLSEAVLVDELNCRLSLSEQVVSLAMLCRDSGVTGIVASAAEVPVLRQALGQSMVLVTPGVRPAWSEANDQSRVVTPLQALRSGSDYLVIGRPITQAVDRREAARRIVSEMEEV